MTELGTRRRPRDRKAQIAATAGDLFRRQGYHGTAMSDIATAVGITAPALYRHYPNKQAILADVVLSAVDGLVSTINAALDSATGPADQLRRLLDDLAALAVEQRDASALWQREGHHLEKAERDERSRELTQAIRRWIAVLRRSRPELSGSDADLLCWSALSVYGSISMHHVSPARIRLERLLPDLAGAALRCDVVSPPVRVVVDHRGWPTHHVPTIRREQLLASAVSLFRERGFHSVSMEDIGNTAGIAGPSVYRHFAGKAELLAAAMDRIAERLALSMRLSFELGLPPQQTLEHLILSYVEITIQHRDGIAVYLSEGRNLPEPKATDLRRMQHGYFAEWSRLVVSCRDGWTERDARIAVHAAVSVVVDAVRTPRFSRRPRLAAELAGLAGTIVHGR
ncbi:MAG TPA: TetR family transcriptional regulator [Mycobacteriales bacterium]|nr:TetR family transcriptional regulator [Mycobacteriales bacterium]